MCRKVFHSHIHPLVCTSLHHRVQIPRQQIQSFDKKMKILVCVTRQRDWVVLQISCMGADINFETWTFVEDVQLVVIFDPWLSPIYKCLSVTEHSPQHSDSHNRNPLHMKDRNLGSVCEYKWLGTSSYISEPAP